MQHRYIVKLSDSTELFPLCWVPLFFIFYFAEHTSSLSFYKLFMSESLSPLRSFYSVNVNVSCHFKYYYVHGAVKELGGNGAGSSILS